MLVNINVQDREVVSFQQHLDGWNGGAHHTSRLDTGGAVVFNERNDVPTLFFGKGFFSDQHGACTIVEGAGIACSYGSSSVKDRTQIGE